MLSPTSAIVGMGLSNDMALITDGRFSGGTSGPCVGHVEMEAYNGGAIGAIKDGDIIEIDIPNRQINLKIPEKEIERRLKNLPEFEPKIKEGYLARYAVLVSSADKGAVLPK